jgi:ABC-type lipoprotein export system ATPase subunit
VSLELRDVTHRYAPGAAPVLRELSFVFPADHSIAVVGPSGSGKTTLLAIAGLLTRPSEGEVLIDGTPVAGSQAAALRTRLFAWVFQTVNVLSARSVEDNAMLGLLARGTGEGEARKEAGAALATVGLGELAGRSANSLSGGELQRLCIARAIAARPRFLLADEPTGQLDRATTERVTRALIEGRPAGTTLLVVTHDARVAAQCDLVLALQDGQLSIGGVA